MTTDLPDRDTDTLRLFNYRNQLLTTIREHSLTSPETQSKLFILQNCCRVFRDALHCEAWAAHIDPNTETLVLFTSTHQNHPSLRLQKRVAQFLKRRFGCDFSTFKEPITQGTQEKEENGAAIPFDKHLLWPIGYRDYNFGFIYLHCNTKNQITSLKIKFIRDVINDIGFALFSQETARRLKEERDFNKEIIDTIQALMVTIHPCGTIISFNQRAEEVTGYTESEVFEKYWVDVLITPKDRLKFQQIFSETLKGTESHVSFNAPLLTKDGQIKQVNWQGSIRHNIDQGQVGLVMIGIDETETLAVDHQIHMLTARWDKIFIAIQDPVLVVSNDSIILDANPATFSATKKKRDEVVGKRLCDILHGGHDGKNHCPLERFIGYQKTQISETELVGLNGLYMLTVTPLVEENGEINATLLVARNLTQEEVMRAEAIRAAQLAALGELASGVAHEINNPINGIINYARIILDEPGDPESTDHLQNIVNEGKRIAKIVSNLLDFARRRDEVLSHSTLDKVVTNSLELVSHLLKKDGIICSVDIDTSLPTLMCNEQQLQQVVLNLLSNARYALNNKFSQPCAEKIIEITGELSHSDNQKMVRLSITDHGTGIADEVQDRLFDPFFSTKPKGEGTGLGLSISHGLVKDHGGFIRVASVYGEWTRCSVYLPVEK